MALVALALGLSPLFAQQSQNGEETKGKVVTLDGRIVNLRAYMTGQSSDASEPEHSSARPAGMQEDNTNRHEKAGHHPDMTASGPCALETTQGLIILGTDAGKRASECQHKVGDQVKLRGRLFEKAGLKYLVVEDLEPINPAGAKPQP